MKRKRRSSGQREAICKSRNWTCHLCDGPIDPVRQSYQLDHIKPLWAGGEDTDDNLGPAHNKCHLQKSVGDTPIIAKANRMRAKHLGTKRKGRPMWGSRLSPWKKKLDGTVVRRT